MAARTLDIEDEIEKVREEMPEKSQGYVATITVSERLFRQSDPPMLEIVLLDPEKDEVAFRRVSGPLEGEEKGEWLIGPLEEALEEALDWKDEIDAMKEPVDEELKEEFEE